MTDQQAKNALHELVWDGLSINDHLRLGKEWNAEALRRAWPTPREYWKRHSYRPIGRWKYSLDDEDENPPGKDVK